MKRKRPMSPDLPMEKSDLAVSFLRHGRGLSKGKFRANREKGCAAGIRKIENERSFQERSEEDVQSRSLIRRLTCAFPGAGVNNGNMPPKSKPTVVPDKLAYTIPEAAAKMSTNEWFVRKVIHENKLKFIPGGKEFLIPHQAILDFLAAESRTYTTEPSMKADGQVSQKPDATQ